MAPANQLDSISSDARIRAEALSLSHLTWDTTVTIRFHIFGSPSFPVCGDNSTVLSFACNCFCVIAISVGKFLTFQPAFAGCQLPIRPGIQARWFAPIQRFFVSCSPRRSRPSQPTTSPNMTFAFTDAGAKCRRPFAPRTERFVNASSASSSCGLLHMPHGRRHWQCKMAFEYVNAMLNHRCRLELLELRVRVQLSRPILESREVSPADQHRPVNFRGNVVKLLSIQRCILCRKRLTRNSVVLVRNHAFSEIHEPAVFHSSLAQVLAGGFQLLSPVGV